MTGRACLAAALLAAAAPAVLAFGGVGTITGRMVLPPVGTPSVTPGRSPRAQYVLHCAGCHGLDGAGSPAAYVPDLRRLGHFMQVPGGRVFIVSVPGVLGSGLSDTQVAEVANWVLQALAGQPLPEPYTAAEVAQARAHAPVDVAARRHQLLEEGRRLGLAID